MTPSTRVRWGRVAALALWVAAFVFAYAALTRPGGPTLSDCLVLIMATTLTLGVLYVAWAD